MFGLLPSMGAHAMLSRKLGTSMADRLIVSNQTYSAEEMYELGHGASPGRERVRACPRARSSSVKCHKQAPPGPGHRAQGVESLTNRARLDELKRIVDLVGRHRALKLSRGEPQSDEPADGAPRSASGCRRGQP